VLQYDAPRLVLDLLLCSCRLGQPSTKQAYVFEIVAPKFTVAFAAPTGEQMMGTRRKFHR
jgi:hypothetical protein